MIMKNRATLTRRDFLARVQAAGIALPLAGNLDLLNSFGIPKSQIFRNDYFSVSFDTKTGRLDISRSNDEKLLSGSVTRAFTNQGYISSGQSSFRHSVTLIRISDQLGEGKQIVITSSDSDKKIELNQKIFLYNNLHGVLVEADCCNRSSKPIVLRSIEPICVNNETGGALYWPQTVKLLTNGAMYYNPGEVIDFDPSSGKSAQSWWNICLFSGYDREGLSVGSVENLVAQGKISVSRDAGDSVSLVAQSILTEGFILDAGQKARSNRFMLNIGSDPYSTLETFADVMGTLNKARIHSLVNGWCSWFYTYEHVTEDEVIKNAEFASRVLKPYGTQRTICVRC